MSQCQGHLEIELHFKARRLIFLAGGVPFIVTLPRMKTQE
jgi:hypothetical protein